MTDRLQMVTDLGMLAQEATLRGDDRAVAILRAAAGHLMEVHGELLKLEDKRRRDRERKPPKSTDSTDSAISTESVEKGGFPPDPLSSKKPSQQHEERVREAAAINDVNSEMVNRYTTMLTNALNGEWPDVDAFLRRRPYSTWEGWMREMVALIRGGSQFIPADLAQVCRDDAALDRPIGSPKGLRIFMGSARQERLNPEPPPSVQPRKAGGTVAQRTAANGREALKDIA